MESYVTYLDELFPQMIEWRRHLHQNPELSFQEEKTALYIIQHLQNWGVEYKSQVAGHGVVARLEGKHAGPTIALRADMDALPIQDEKICDYSSQVPGVMHACGHDAHTSTLLAIVKTLSGMKDHIRGNFVFIFQPAEEVTPGGAITMIKQGVLEGVDVIYGVHLWAPYPVGHLYCREGYMMAAPDEFTIQLRGKGGHAGLPHQSIDAVAIASHLVVNLQSIVSRMVDPTQPAVVSVGRIQGGSFFNVIAESCILQGTVRTFDAELRIKLKHYVEHMISHTCAMFHAEYELDYKWGYPALENHAREVDRFNQVATRTFGEHAVHIAPQIMAGEDFAYYLEQIPGCFIFVGAGNDTEGITHAHHHPRFDIDEQAMLQASKMLLAMSFDYMDQHAK
jgi:amidohydrolase